MPFYLSSSLRPLLAAACVLLLHGCGGGVSVSADTSPPPPVSAAVSGYAISKVRAQDDAWVAMAERLQPLADVTRPERHLQFAPNGSTVTATYQPPSGWSLIDFALHPSGEVSAVLASDTALRLLRFTRAGRVLTDAGFTDAAVASDPFMSDPLVIRNAQSMVPWATRDAARLAAANEDVALVIRSGRNTVLAYGLHHTSAAGFTRAWRTVVEPGVYIGGIGLTSGTFDPFSGLDNQWQVFMDADFDGHVAVAVGVNLTELVDGHARHFNEPLPATLAHGVLLTRIDRDGRRLGTTVIDTQKKSEIHAVRWTRDGVVLGGRVLSERPADGSGWDGYVAVLRNGSVAPQYNVINADRGEVILDVLPLADGRMLLAGSAGYTQNPAGGSISEAAAPFLAVANAQGALVQRLAVAAGARHNQVRSLTGWRSGWLIGGLQNGPGTHSADANPALLTGDGYVREMKFP